MAEETDNPSPSKAGRAFPRVAIVLAVLVLFGGVLAAKALNGGSAASSSSGDAGATAGAPTVAATITATHNDAVADYAAALKTGKPVYVLFHSLTCQPCVEISAIADQVVPEYADRVVFVNAITDDRSGQQLAAQFQFQFQYIPTSFFISPDGAVTDSFTGSMGSAQMRGYLDALVAAK